MNILICILLVVAILWIISLLVEKGFELSQESDFKELIRDYIEQMTEFTQLKDKLLEMESAYNELSKRMTQFETDFKTDKHICSRCKTEDIKKHPKTKPKAQVQADLKEPLAEKGSNV